MSKKAQVVVTIACMIAVGCIGGTGYVMYTVQKQADDYEDKIYELEQSKAEPSTKKDQTMKKEGASVASFEESTFMPEPTVVSIPTGSGSNVFIDNDTTIADKDALIQNSVCYLGTYGGEPIAWRVLQDDGDRALLVTDYCIDAQPYYYYEDEDNLDYSDFEDEDEYEEYIDELPIPDITWETSELRGFCNDTFYHAAFTDNECQRILPTSIETNDGSSTIDNVFILSGEEWDTYCTDLDFRIGYPTAYAISQGIFTSNGMFNASSIGKCSYWVRGASSSGGDPDNYADWIDFHGEWRYNSPINDTGMGVRPAIWITK